MKYLNFVLPAFAADIIYINNFKIYIKSAAGNLKWMCLSVEFDSILQKKSYTSSCVPFNTGYLLLYTSIMHTKICGSIWERCLYKEHEVLISYG